MYVKITKTYVNGVLEHASASLHDEDIEDHRALALRYPTWTVIDNTEDYLCYNFIPLQKNPLFPKDFNGDLSKCDEPFFIQDNSRLRVVEVCSIKKE